MTLTDITSKSNYSKNDQPNNIQSNNNQPNLAINPANICQNPQQASTWLQQGRVLAYPTESVWGMGCDAYNEAAVQQILAIKHRPMAKGLIVVTDSLERIQPLLTSLTDTQRQAIVASWQPIHRLCYLNNSSNPSAQQATTWLLPKDKLPTNKSHTIPEWLTGQHDSLAVRVIAHPIIQQLCAQLVSAINPYGFIVSTSCNPAGQPPATSLSSAVDYFSHCSNIAYLQGATLGYTMPSQIKDAVTGQVIR